MSIRFRAASLLFLLLIAAAAALLRPDRAARSVSAMAAHYLCGAVFIQDLPASEVFDELVKPLSSVLAPLLSYSVDERQHTVSAHIGGHFFIQRATWTEGYGCRLAHSSSPSSPLPEDTHAAATTSTFAPRAAVTTSNASLHAALEQLFTENGAQRQVKAVVIVANDRVIAERYATGYGPDTPLLSFSVAKVVTNALAGILVGQGRLAMERPVGRRDWAGRQDQRASITPNDLLRMQSGLDAAERGDGFDAVTHMLLLHDDMARYAAGRRLRAPPGTQWEYTSANTVLLCRLLGDIVGGGTRGMRTFANRELFEPTGMQHVTMEFDGAGTFVGSTFVYASARDYARLGLLYLNDGVTHDGQRLLPAGWVEYSRDRTLMSDYGAGFWLTEGDSSNARRLRELGYPADGYYAWGALGQRIYIVPSAGIVMVRFGYSHTPDHDVDADMRVLRTAIATLN